MEQILKQHNVDKIKFYYHKTPLVNNIFTACLFIDSKKKQIVSRGVAVCSLKDTHNKAKGRNKSFGRAIKAINKQKNSNKIKSKARENEFVNRSFKCRNEQEIKKFQENLSLELANIDPTTTVSILTDKYTKYEFKFPVNYPIRLTNKYFKYKSSYKPKPITTEEIALFKK